MPTATDRPAPLSQSARRALWRARRDSCAPLLAQARRLLTPRLVMEDWTGFRTWYTLAGVLALDPGSPRQIKDVRDKLTEDVADYLIPRPWDQEPRAVGRPTEKVLELLNQCVQVWEEGR